jgi:hypothetical protein
MDEEYTLGIIGARTFTDYSRLEGSLVDIIKKYGLPHTVVSGGARGADRLAITWAMNRGINMINHQPNWNRYGKEAAYIRNCKIVEDADIIIAFPSHKGRGTQMTLEIAKEQNVECIVDESWEFQD